MGAAERMEVGLKAEVGHWIAGQATAGRALRRQDVYNPATGAVARQVVLAEPQDGRRPWPPRRRRCPAGRRRLRSAVRG